MYVPVCGRFVTNEGRIAGYVPEFRAKILSTFYP
ncbi:DUF6783 domain-containing protein [uncultured Robinsoniella sp.]